MRVCVATPTKVGLTETFIRAHVENLPHDVLCINGYWLDYSWKDRKLREWYNQSHLERGRWLNLLPRFIEFRLRRRFFASASDIKIASKFLQSQKIDVVLAEYGTAAAFITPACRRTGIPLVAHFHGVDASRFSILEEFADAYSQMFNYAASVISVSLAMSRSLLELGCPPDKIRYNPYGPDPRFFDVEPDFSSHTLLSVGRHTGKKAPYLTLDAFRRAFESCPELMLSMIGEGELLEVSERLVKAWDLEDWVDLHGWAEPSAIREHMKNSFAFVQHSVEARDGDSEGMPVAVLEAGAAALPVVSTQHAGIPDAVIQGQTGLLVEPGDTQAMADAILQLSKDKELAKTMGEAARAHIKENFSMEKHIGVLNEILVDAAQ